MPQRNVSARSLFLAFTSMLVSVLLAGCAGGYGGGNGGGNQNAPAGLAATPGNAQVSLTWNASSGATGYYVKRSTASGSEAQIATASATSYTDTGLTNGTTYYYEVSAYNSYGQSPNSSEVSATPTAPGTPPPTPTGLLATAGNAQVSLTWNASAGATSYNVKRSTATGGPYSPAGSPTTNSFTDTGLANSTKYFYVVSAVNSSGQSANSTEVNSTPTAPATAVDVTVDTLADRHAINPNVYGGSFPKDAATITDSGLTVVRWGGNGTSEYNWKLGTTNADNDYFFEDFTFCGLGGYPTNATCTDSDSTQFITDVKAVGSNPLMTMVMLPWVAQSAEVASPPNNHWSFSVAKYGAQCAVDPYNTDAGNGIVAGTCNAPNPTYLTANPNDAYFPLLDDHTSPCPAATCEYRNDWATALATAFGNAPHFYNMDNEIDIWGGTHRDIHPNPSTYDELRDVYLTKARDLQVWDPAAIRFGPVSCCWYFYWRSAAGGSETTAHGGVDFLPWWLNEVAWSDADAGSRSLEYFDIHAYPDGPSTSGLTQAQKQALATRVYRDWWDPSYTSEASYIVNGGFSIQPTDSKPFRIPRMRALLHTIYPGTKFSVTEWSAAFAGESDFSTALGDADGYGILGRERVDLASRWTAPIPGNPNYLALKLYRNYDGSHSTFGTTSLSATHNADPNLFSVYGALSPAGTQLTLMVLNKDPSNAASVTFALNNFTAGTFLSYQLSSTSPTSIVPAASQPWNGTQVFPPYSATLLVVSGTVTKVPSADWDLNPDTIQIPANGTIILAPAITSATSNSATVTLSSPQIAGGGGTIVVTGPTITTSADGAVTITAGSTPGFYHFSLLGTDNTGVAQTQNGWLLVQDPAATLTKSTDPGSGTGGTPITLAVTLTAGSSGGTSNGASIHFSTDAGNFGGASKTIATTNNSGVASVTLTLPSTSGTTVHVTAEGPYGLGHPSVVFSEKVN